MKIGVWLRYRVPPRGASRSSRNVSSGMRWTPRQRLNSAGDVAIDSKSRQLVGIGGVGAHYGGGATVELLAVKSGARASAHADRGAEVASASDDPVAEPLPLAGVAGQRRVEVAPVSGDGRS